MSVCCRVQSLPAMRIRAVRVFPRACAWRWLLCALHLSAAPSALSVRPRVPARLRSLPPRPSCSGDGCRTGGLFRCKPPSASATGAPPTLLVFGATCATLFGALSSLSPESGRERRRSGSWSRGLSRVACRPLFLTQGPSSCPPLKSHRWCCCGFDVARSELLPAAAAGGHCISALRSAARNHRGADSSDVARPKPEVGIRVRLTRCDAAIARAASSGASLPLPPPPPLPNRIHRTPLNHAQHRESRVDPGPQHRCCMLPPLSCCMLIIACSLFVCFRSVQSIRPPLSLGVAVRSCSAAPRACCFCLDHASDEPQRCCIVLRCHRCLGSAGSSGAVLSPPPFAAAASKRPRTTDDARADRGADSQTRRSVVDALCAR